MAFSTPILTLLPALCSPPHQQVFPPSSVSCLLLPVFILSCLPRISLNTVPYLSLGLPRLILPGSRNYAALFGSVSSQSFLRVQPTVICSSPVSLSSSSALPPLPLTPPFFACLSSLLLICFVPSCFRTLVAFILLL